MQGNWACKIIARSPWYELASEKERERERERERAREREMFYQGFITALFVLTRRRQERDIRGVLPMRDIGGGGGTVIPGTWLPS